MFNTDVNVASDKVNDVQKGLFGKNTYKFSLSAAGEGNAVAKIIL